jgi:hypothetical protein
MRALASAVGIRGKINMGRRLKVTNIFAMARPAIIAVTLMVAAAPAAAQFSESYTFLKAVRDADGAAVTKSLQNPGSTLINTRDYSNGEAALHIVVKRRDMTWLPFLLSKGANPDIRDNDGNSPLVIATQLGFADGVQMLLNFRAMVDQPNARGETPLIIATQQRNIPIIKILIAGGADPKKPDRIAGKSAHDYAADDARSAAVLKILDEAPVVKPKPKISGPILH